MSYKVELSRSADRELWRIVEPFRTRLFMAIKGLAVEPRPIGSKNLAGHKGAWRIRVGNFRVLYTMDDVVRVVRVESVGDRKDVYR